MCGCETKKKCAIEEIDGKLLIWSRVAEKEHCSKVVGLIINEKSKPYVREFKQVSPRIY